PSRPTQAAAGVNPIYRPLQPTEVPANIRAFLDNDTASGKDVRYYRTKYGSQLAYEAKWDDPKTGKEMRHYVSDAGQTLVRGESVDDENERLASAAARRFRERDRESRDRETRADTATTAGARETKTGRDERNTMPKAVQTQMRRLTEGGKDVKFYRTKYGSEAAFEAKFT